LLERLSCPLAVTRGGRRAAGLVRRHRATGAMMNDPRVAFRQIECGRHFSGGVVEHVAKQQHGPLRRRQRLERLEKRQ